MIGLVENIKKNYNIYINNNEIYKLGITTINDIYLIYSHKIKYIIKVYNVDEEKQVINSVYTQKNIYKTLKITANIIENKKNKLYTKYDEKFYIIQEYIEEQKNEKIDLVTKTAKTLYFLHQELKKLDKKIYKNKNESRDYNSINEEIKKEEKRLYKINVTNEVKQIFNKLLNKRKQLLKKYKCSYLPKEFQIIHRDIRLGNIIVNDDKIFFIDFDYVAYGDLLFEIGSASMLISNFEIEKAREFLNEYNSYLKIKYTAEEVYSNLLSYYVQSDFPIKLINKIENSALIEFIENRIKCLEFCEEILYK